MFRRLIRLAVGAVGCSLAVAAIAAPTAQAASYDGYCEYEEVCFYWYDKWTSVADFSNWEIFNHADFRFVGPGSGRGEGLNDNAVMVLNNRQRKICVSEHSYGRGVTVQIPAWTYRSLGSLTNRQSGHRVCW